MDYSIFHDYWIISMKQPDFIMLRHEYIPMRIMIESWFVKHHWLSNTPGATFTNIDLL